MKSFIGFAAIIFMSLLISCADGDTPATDKSLAPVNEAKVITPLTVSDTLLSDTSTGKSAVTSTAHPVTLDKKVSNIAITPSGSKTTAGLNPEHGQPGHRCDISVGAPLNSPSKPQSTPQITTTPVTTPSAKPATQITPTAASATGNQKLNPPHGQPGHDCAIAVGAPLKN